MVEVSRSDFEAALAAFNNRPASTPGKEGTPFNRGPRKTKTRHGNNASADKSHSYKLEKSLAAPTQTSDEEEELPEPDDNPELIFKALKRRNVCYYHAKGISCPHSSKPTGCKYSHDERVVRFGQYKPRSVAQMAAMDMAQAYGAEEEIRSESTNGTSSTRLDTPEH